VTDSSFEMRLNSYWWSDEKKLLTGWQGESQISYQPTGHSWYHYLYEEFRTLILNTNSAQICYSHSQFAIAILPHRKSHTSVTCPVPCRFKVGVEVGIRVGVRIGVSVIYNARGTLLSCVTSKFRRGRITRTFQVILICEWQWCTFFVPFLRRHMNIAIGVDVVLLELKPWLDSFSCILVLLT
jgi:hypothetical protein